MQNVGQSESKKLDCKVNSTNSSSVPSSTSTKPTTMAKYNPSGGAGVGNNTSVSSSSGSGNCKNMSSLIATNNKFASTTSSPIKSDTETYSEFQPRVSDSSESDEESVSEVIEKLAVKKKIEFFPFISLCDERFFSLARIRAHTHTHSFILAHQHKIRMHAFIFTYIYTL